MTETILIVDDEESVRRTFGEWLQGSGWPITVLAVADAEAALTAANTQAIDLAILDWNLGSGSDGLRLLEDLVEFHPDLTAILVTGYAAHATPLQALRRGVRDYLDKNQDLTREVFLNAVKRQLDKITPAKRQRHLNQSLKSFRDAVEKAIPLVRDTSAFRDPLPLPGAVRSLFRFAIRGTGATAGALVVHRVENSVESTRVYDADGQLIECPAIPFGRTIAANMLSHGKSRVLSNFAADATLKLFPFEQSHSTLLAVPLTIRPGTRVVIELFGKPHFTSEDESLATLAGEIGVELLRHSLAERDTHQLLYDALENALKASDAVTSTLTGSGAVAEVLKGPTGGPGGDEGLVLDLLHAVRALSQRHGDPALQHSVIVIRELKTLLDSLTE